MSALASHQGRQQGVALLVVIIMLFALSVLGISSMRDAGLESRLATNSAVAATTFQAAESATDVILNDSTNLTEAWGLPGNSVTHTLPVHIPGGGVIEADLTYLGEGSALGYSLGQTGGGFVSLRYEVRGTATLDSLNARATVQQNAYRIAPSN